MPSSAVRPSPASPTTSKPGSSSMPYLISSRSSGTSSTRYTEIGLRSVTDPPWPSVSGSRSIAPRHGCRPLPSQLTGAECHLAALLAEQLGDDQPCLLQGPDHQVG